MSAQRKDPHAMQCYTCPDVLQMYADRSNPELYQNPAGVSEVCEWIKEAEEKVHSDAADIYNCILANFGGCHPLTARIADPQGGIGVKIKDRVKKMAPHKKIRWHILTIFRMFVMLCLHMFDYVKDIGELQL